MLGNILKWTTCLNILCQSNKDWVKVFRFYFQSEQVVDKLTSESLEKSRYTHILLTSGGFLTLYLISPNFSYLFILMAKFYILFIV